MLTLTRKKRQKSRSSFQVALLVCALSALFVTSFAFAAPIVLPEAPTRWITDSAGMLSAKTTHDIDAQLEDYQRQTGHQVVVWIGSSIGAQSLDEFAVETFKAWKLGRKGKDDGVLLAVLTQDRRIAIEVGYGLEGNLPDAVASRIVHDVMVPKLRENQADLAITLGVNAILNAIEGKAFVMNAPATATEKTKVSVFQIVLFAFLGLGFVFLLITHPTLALSLLYVMANRAGQGGSGGGGFSGGGGRSGGGGAKGSW